LAVGVVEGFFEAAERVAHDVAVAVLVVAEVKIDVEGFADVADAAVEVVGESVVPMSLPAVATVPSAL
jgi:hypothetical protein